MSLDLNKAFNGNLSSQVKYLLTFIEENELGNKLEAQLTCLTEDEPSKPDIYTLEAHSDKVADLPLSFMTTLLNTMVDISYANDDAARFTMLHNDGDKAYHLWIGPPEMREPFETRFSLSIVGLDDYDIDNSDDNDFAGFITMDIIKSIIDTDSVEEIYAELLKLSAKKIQLTQ